MYNLCAGSIVKVNETYRELLGLPNVICLTDTQIDKLNIERIIEFFLIDKEVMLSVGFEVKNESPLTFSQNLTNGKHKFIQIIYQNNNWVFKFVDIVIGFEEVEIFNGYLHELQILYKKHTDKELKIDIEKLKRAAN